jgi:hypothetical protein
MDKNMCISFFNLFLFSNPYSLNFVFRILRILYCCIYRFLNGFLFGFIF